MVPTSRCSKGNKKKPKLITSVQEKENKKKHKIQMFNTKAK